MPLETIYIVRHGFRTNWTVDPNTGEYSSTIRSPTGIAADPALTSHGVSQASQLATHLLSVSPPIDAVYSSPYYRCLQTINPFVQLRTQNHQPNAQGIFEDDRAMRIRVEAGVGEWFGSAPFNHPRPAELSKLKGMFPSIDDAYISLITPEQKGESLVELYERLSQTMRVLIEQCDREDGIKTIVVCSHAASIIALGRVLTGQVPENPEEDDFRAFTCGVSVYKRLDAGQVSDKTIPIGGWSCEVNSDCSFLENGEERGWRFAGDEAFPGTGSMAVDDPKL